MNCSFIRKQCSDVFKESFDGMFEHLANGGKGGKVS